MGGKLLPIDIISQKQALENQEKIKTIIKTVILCGRQNFSDRISTYGVFSTKSAREKRKEFSCFITIVHKRAFGFSNIHTKNKYCEYLKIILFRPLLQKKKIQFENYGTTTTVIVDWKSYIRTTYGYEL